MNEIAPGRKIIHAIGILYIAFGGLGAMSSAMGLVMPAIAAALTGEAMLLGTFWNTNSIIALIWSLFHICAGIMGIKNCANLEKAAWLKVFGIIDIGLAVLTSIFAGMVFATLLVGPSDYFVMIVTAVFMGFFVLAFRLPLSILYIIGAQKNLAARKMRRHCVE